MQKFTHSLPEWRTIRSDKFFEPLAAWHSFARLGSFTWWYRESEASTGSLFVQEGGQFEVAEFQQALLQGPLPKTNDKYIPNLRNELVY